MMIRIPTKASDDSSNNNNNNHNNNNNELIQQRSNISSNNSNSQITPTKDIIAIANHRRQFLLAVNKKPNAALTFPEKVSKTRSDSYSIIRFYIQQLDSIRFDSIRFDLI